MRILVVDDDPAICTALSVLLELHGFESVCARSPLEAVAIAEREPLAAVVQDMNFARSATSGEEGAELFRALRARDASLPVILLTAWGSIESAVALVKEGASDYLTKPWDDERLVASLRNLVALRAFGAETARLREDVARSRARLAREHDLRGIVYASRVMHELVTTALKVAPSDVPVLIAGPNGCGKEKIAEIIQANSRRRDRPFVRVNSGALADTLLESELFGAEAGAFTGAQRARQGRFEAADGGTLFLDEVGNLSPAGQMKLLRVLQTGEFERVGSSFTRRVDVRIVSATNADLQRAVAERTFRQDLLFRLNVIEIAIPPLCERPEDIPALAAALLAVAQKPGEPPPQLDEGAQRALAAHPWPGNVRELQNRIQRALLLGRGGTIRAQDLGLAAACAGVAVPAASPAEPAAATVARESSEAQECPDDSSARLAIEAALRDAAGNVSEAAVRLGLSRQALYRRMKRLGLTVERTLRGGR